MTNEELEKKIEMLRGQGNQVDVGGVLADVLKALAPKYAKGKVRTPNAVGKIDKDELIEQLETTESELAKLFERGTTGLMYSAVSEEDYHTFIHNIDKRVEESDGEVITTSVTFNHLKMTGKKGQAGMIRYIRSIDIETGIDEYYIEFVMNPASL